MTFSRDSILGCIVGGALGDLVGGAPERKNLTLSDDTQLTLATCEAVTVIGTISPEAVASSFLRWFRAHALTGLGSATLKALRDIDAGVHWALSGARGEMSAGNGAAMRIAPLAFVIDPLDPAGRRTVRDICRITHHNDEAYIGALAVLASLRPPDDIPPPGFHHLMNLLPDSRVRDRLLALSELAPGIPLCAVADRFGSSGYVVETVPLALLIAARVTVSSFEAVLGEMARIGGDTDTICSIAGQVAGARLGLSTLPSHLVNLAEVQAIIPTAEAFARRVAGDT